MLRQTWIAHMFFWSNLLNWWYCWYWCAVNQGSFHILTLNPYSYIPRYWKYCKWLKCLFTSSWFNNNMFSFIMSCKKVVLHSFAWYNICLSHSYFFIVPCRCKDLLVISEWSCILVERNPETIRQNQTLLISLFCTDFVCLLLFLSSQSGQYL